MPYDAIKALALLRIGAGQPHATFREGQEEAIEQLVAGPCRLLVVQKTGWGKSLVYFITTALLRGEAAGPTLLISPLLALMRNQLVAASRMGLRAETINSDNPQDWRGVEAAIRRDEVDILLISPERLASARFVAEVLTRIAGRIALLVVDEAHCISDWGHDFRPHYRLLERIVRTLPPNLRLLATTATANLRVMKDLERVLGQGLVVSRGELGRPSLSLQTIHMPSQAARLAWLAEQLPLLPGHGIVYVLTRRDAVLVSEWLRHRGLTVAAYSGETEGRADLEDALLANDVKALVATSALGMGFDKPDLAFVIHYQAPGSVVAYYQQVGRAGRALAAARGVLLSGQEDDEIHDFFIRSAFPTREEVGVVLAALEAAPAGLSVPALLTRVNLSTGRIEKTLQLLSLESPAPLVRQGATWQLTAATLSPEFWARAERLGGLRRAEQAQMNEYVALGEGHMEFLAAALDGPPGPPAPRPLAPLPISAEPATIREAEAFLRRLHLPIEPRLQWPGGGLPRYAQKGRIPRGRQAEVGRALCMWGGAGWGELVRRGKYKDGRFADLLVDACVELLRTWGPRPVPTWVTCVPSLRHPELVPDLSRRLAGALKLPFVAALERTDDRPEQKTMANGAMQARNVDGSLALMTGPLPDGPVVLVDDMVDSRWTVTIAAWLLRGRTAHEVFPLALASMGPDA